MLEKCKSIQGGDTRLFYLWFTCFKLMGPHRSLYNNSVPDYVQ